MPRLTIRGLSVEQICLISESLIEQLSDICGCEADDFTMECVQHTAVFGGKIVQAFPFIEVAWFERGEDIRNQMAAAITNHVLNLGIVEMEVAFITYAKDAYYSNGISYK
ncbi:DUF1904 family protein [Paenibacillus sp. N3.4]|uniref:DUF1904 family protein n=1 Tax=Paenibacillus sp. N3.4 TaxID=2603222 RepID=UPI0011C8121F|nr:DUF1904 family protein [Paenibacillus sp. N3.4]TXK80042.1 DUF1904 family protein [Paenibacillus sp. N3.4]